jgi:hypothetical protein
MRHLAELYHAQGDFDRALPLYEDALRVLGKFFKPIHPDALMAHVGRGKLWMDVGKLAEAEAELREALDGQRRVLGKNHPHTARTAFLLGVCLAPRVWERIEPGCPQPGSSCREPLTRSARIDSFPNSPGQIARAGRVAGTRASSPHDGLSTAA